MNSSDFLFWFFSMLVPVTAILVFGAALIVHIVMSQRTRRQAIAKGLSPEQCAGPTRGGATLRIGMLSCGFALGLFAIGLFKLEQDSPYTWALLLLGCGGALVLNHFLLRRPRGPTSQE